MASSATRRRRRRRRNRVIRWIAAIVAVILLVVLLGLFARSCGDEDPRPQTMVYVDTSGSNHPRLGNELAAEVEQIIGEASDGRATISFFKVDEASVSETEIIPEVDFGRPLGESGLMQDSWRTQKQRRLLADYRAWAEDVPEAEGTDLLGALENAANQPTKAGHDKQVILLTDGLNLTEVWDWNRGPLDGPGCKRLAGDLALASLDGASVTIRGGGHSILDSEENVKLKACWQALLQEMGATLPADWYQN